MIHFVGAGSGAPDLITVRGKKYLEEADVVIYAGSLVNPKLLECTKDICTIYNSAKMTLEEVLSVMEKAEILVFTVLSGNRWMFWMKRESLMITVLASVHSAAQQAH